MPIDPRVPLAVRPAGPIQQPNVGRIMLQAGAIKGQRQKAQLRDLQLQEAQALAKTRPERMALQTRRDEAQTKHAELKMLEAQNDIIVDAANAALKYDTQKAWEWAIAKVRQAGIELPSDVPALWGEKARKYAEYALTESLGAKEQLRQYWKQQELLREQEQQQYEREKDTRTYEQKERHFKESQATTRRGQDLRSQRSKQPTESQAVDKITKLQNMKVKLLEGEKLDPAMAFLMARDPKGAKELREHMQSGNPQSQDIVLQAINAAIQYYSPFATGQYRQESGLKPPSSDPLGIR